MLDSFVSFSSNADVDSFPSFKSFDKINDAFTVDAQDQREMQSVTQKPLGTSNTSPERAFRAPSKPRAFLPKRNTSSLINKTTDANVSSTIQCDICSVPITSSVQFDSHIKGKRHQAQLAATLSKDPEHKSLSYTELCARRQTTTSLQVPTGGKEEEKPAVPPVSVAPVAVETTVNEETPAAPLVLSKKINCNMCNVSCNSQQMFDIHIAGKKHQMKLKTNSLTGPAPPRVIPDNIPVLSTSNYCDICLLQFNSQEEFTGHIAHKRHQTRVKEAELCAQESAGMNVNFDEFKIPESNVDSKNFDYQCTTCDKKVKGKLQLILHIKSPQHTRRSSQPHDQRRRESNSRSGHQATRGGMTRGGPNAIMRGASARGRSFSSFRGSTRSPGMSRPYRPQAPYRGHASQSFSQRADRPPQMQQQALNDLFGAFNNDPPPPAPSFSSNTSFNRNSSKRFPQQKEDGNQFDAFQPKRMRTFNENADQQFYPDSGNFYPPSSASSFPTYQANNYDNQWSNNNNDYNNQWSSPADWQGQQPGSNFSAEQQYTTRASTQPPLPNYDPPPLPPPSSSFHHYPPSQAPRFDTNFNQNSFRH